MWGTLPFVTSTTVKSTIHNVLPVSDDAITVKRKAKTRPHAKHCWWFVITGTEETLLTMEANWNRMTLQTGWKLQPCFAPIVCEGDDSAPTPAASTEADATTNNAPPADILTTDLVNGSTDSDDSNGDRQANTDTSGGTANDTPTPSHGND